jgi:hypothetical protein
MVGVLLVMLFFVSSEFRSLVWRILRTEFLPAKAQRQRNEVMVIAESMSSEFSEIEIWKSEW